MAEIGEWRRKKKRMKEKKNPSTVSNNAPRTNERMSLEITKPFEYSLGIWYTKYLPKNDSWICFCVSNRCVCDHKIDLRYSNHRRSDKENFFSVWEIWLCVLECGRRACFIYQCGCRECRSLGGYRYIFIVSHQFISHRIRRQYTHIYIRNMYRWNAEKIIISSYCSQTNLVYFAFGHLLEYRLLICFFYRVRCNITFDFNMCCICFMGTLNVSKAVKIRWNETRKKKMWQKWKCSATNWISLFNSMGICIFFFWCLPTSNTNTALLLPIWYTVYA